MGIEAEELRVSFFGVIAATRPATAGTAPVDELSAAIYPGTVAEVAWAWMIRGEDMIAGATIPTIVIVVQRINSMANLPSMQSR